MKTQGKLNFRKWWKVEAEKVEKKMVENFLPSLDAASLSLQCGNIHFAMKIQTAKTKPRECLT